MMKWASGDNVRLTGIEIKLLLIALRVMNGPGQTYIPEMVGPDDCNVIELTQLCPKCH